MRLALRLREWRRRRSHATISRDQLLPSWLGLGDLGFDVLVWLLFLVPPSALLGFVAWRWLG
ncbi:MAG: hypothetical protein F4X38_07915 [Acidimicrobiaceae bacterium]|nr:hypothetical protein [Acidimicrobiaceae bacterium]